jgi:hypothetical protein
MIQWREKWKRNRSISFTIIGSPLQFDIPGFLVHELLSLPVNMFTDKPIINFEGTEISF